MSAADGHRARLRANTAQALADGATKTEVLADVVAAMRGHQRPAADDLAIASDLADVLDDDMAHGGLR